MKTNKFLLSALAALAMGTMASCTNDDIAGGSGGTAEQDGNRYMAIRITTPSAINRGLANEDAEFEEGESEAKESQITAESIRFYFFDENGNPFTLVQANTDGTVSKNNMVKPTSINTIINTPGSSESSIEGVLVLGKQDTPYIGKTPTYVIAAANMSETEFEGIANKTLAKCAELPISKASGTGELDWSNFAMSNSVYALQTNYAADNTVKWRKVMASLIKPGEYDESGNYKSGNICNSIADAQKNPVDIYMERIACKVRVKGLGLYTSKDADGNDENYFIESQTVGNEEGQNLYVELTGWQLCNRYMYANIYKDIDASANYFNNWNDINRHRCYWAITPKDITGGKLIDNSYDIYQKYETGEDGTQRAVTMTQFQYTNSDDATAPADKKKQYTYPQTQFQPSSVTDRTTNATAIVFRGVVKEKLADGTYKAIDLIRWAGGYYRTEAFKEIVANAYNTTNGTNVTTNQVIFKQQANKNKYDTYIRLTNGSEAVMTNYSNIQHWIDGQTSYYLNIQHAVDPENKPLYGLVRNHIYDHTVTGVVGLGIPGNEHENPEEEEESYIACRVNVLNWRVISKNVVLE